MSQFCSIEKGGEVNAEKQLKMFVSLLSTKSEIFKDAKQIDIVTATEEGFKRRDGDRSYLVFDKGYLMHYMKHLIDA